jgi:hypothetical protein
MGFSVAFSARPSFSLSSSKATRLESESRFYQPLTRCLQAAADRHHTPPMTPKNLLRIDSLTNP